MVRVKNCKWLVGVNDAGRRVGVSHPRARHTDDDVELVRELAARGVSRQDLAVKFECSPETIKKWVRGERRGQTAVAWVREDRRGR